MKKFLFSLLTLAAALTVASCQKELVGNPDPILGGPAVNATLSVNVNGVATKAFAAAENAKKLHIAFYSGGEMVASISKVGAEAIDLTSTTYNYNIKLSRGAAYDIICWAEAAESPYALDFNAKTVTYKDNVSLTANNDAYDAFYGVASLTADQTKNTVDLTIELKRPFAQVNVLVPDENAAAYTSFSSAMTVTVPTTMSLADGSLSGNPVAVTFANAAINEATIKDGHKYVAMNYVFAPAEAANYAVSFTVTPNVAEDAKTRTLDAVSLKRNRRTNLIGNIFDDAVDNITVVIIPTPGDPTEQDINAVAADLDISLDPEATLDVPVGQTASFTITTNSTGTASVASANENFATAELTTDGSAQATNTHTVTVTGVANGTTTVTVDIAAGQTKASLKPAQVVVTVKVGTGEPDLEQVATPTFTPAAGEYTEAQNVTISCETEGATIYYTTDGTDPTTASTTYSAPIAVSATTTIKAIAAKEGMTTSEVAEAAYTITAQPAGTLENPYTVAQVREFIDGLAGSTSTDVVYVKGKVCKDSYAFAAGKTASFYISDDGQQSSDQFEAYKVAYLGKAAFETGNRAIVVGDEVIVAGKVKKYTTSGDNPTSTYETTGDDDSFVYSINGCTEAVKPVTFSPEAGDLSAATTVTLSCATSGATIYYTIDGSAPTTSSPVYSEAINVSATTTIKAIAVKSGLLGTNVCVASYTFPIVGGVTVKAVIANYASSHEWVNATKYSEIVIDDNITVTTDAGGNTGKYYTSDNTWRCYQSDFSGDKKITITAATGKELVSIKFTYTSKNTGTLLCGTSVISSGEAHTVSGSSVDIKVGNTTENSTNGQALITEIEVTYK